MTAPTPLTDTFIKNCIASGAITPPINDHGPSGRWVGLLVAACLILGTAAVACGMAWR